MKKLLFLFLAVASSVTMSAQVFFGKLGNDVFVENAVKDAVVIMKSHYQLKDNQTGQMYGRYSNNYFGSCYTIGYSIPSGYVTGSEILRPWEQDQAFKKYKDNPRFTPILLDSLWARPALSQDQMNVRAFAKGEFQPDTCFCTLPAGTVRDSLFLLPANQTGELKGWFLWYMLPTGVEAIEESTQLSISSVFETVTLKDSSAVKVHAPLRQERIVGGIFVVPEITQIGKVEFRLRGFLAPDGDEGWELMPYSQSWEQGSDKVNKEKTEEKTTEKPVEDDLSELSPIKPSKEKDRKKNNKKK